MIWVHMHMFTRWDLMICMVCHNVLAEENVHVYVCSRVIICVGSCISEPLYTRSDIH